MSEKRHEVGSAHDEAPPGTIRTGSIAASAGGEPEDEPSAPPLSRELAGAELGLRRIARKAAAVERRMRLARALTAGTVALAGALLGVAIVIACAKTQYLSDPRARKLLIGLAGAPLLAAVVAWFRPLPKLAGALALDKQAGLNDRLSTALSFAREKEPTPFMRAAMIDAVQYVDRAVPRKAFSLLAVLLLLVPEIVACFALGGVVYVVSLLELRKHTPVAYAPTVNAMEVSEDDLEAMAELGRQMLDNPHADAETKAAIEEYNRLVEDLKNKRIDRNEAFRRMAMLDNKLQKSSELDKKAFEEAMKKLGEELKKNELTKDIGVAFEKGDKKDAEKKMKALATKLKDKNFKPSDDQKKALADALKKAAQRDREKNLAAIKAAKEKAQADIDKMRADKEKNGGKETPDMEKQRKEKERELERLDREEKMQQSGDRQLDKLDRDLENAANDIMKDLGLGAQDLDSGAEDVNKMAEDEMSAEEKEELRQRLKELHDLLVQQGKLNPDQIKKMKDFAQKAKGQGKKKGKGKKGKLGEFDPNGDPNGGGDDKGDDKGDGDDGDQDGDGKGQKWTLGPNGEKIPMPGAGQPGGSQPGGAGNQPGGSGNQPGGKDGGQPGGSQAGTGHENGLGKKTSMKAGTYDTQVAGANAGKGPDRSKVIQGAADKGFVGQGYKQVYGEYKTVAESALKQDEIPAGYRFYVRRYFDLIRPRE
jgi:hypothetical protein